MRLLKYTHLRGGGKVRMGMRGCGRGCGIGGSAFLRGSPASVGPPSGMGLNSLSKLDIMPLKKNKLMKKISF